MPNRFQAVIYRKMRQSRVLTDATKPRVIELMLALNRKAFQNTFLQVHKSSVWDFKRHKSAEAPGLLRKKNGAPRTGKWSRARYRILFNMIRAGFPALCSCPGATGKKSCSAKQDKIFCPVLMPCPVTFEILIPFPGLLLSGFFRNFVARLAPLRSF